jgi:hypothetical protein
MKLLFSKTGSDYTNRLKSDCEKVIHNISTMRENDIFHSQNISTLAFQKLISN